jgi:hypothetical protein
MNIIFAKYPTAIVQNTPFTGNLIAVTRVSLPACFFLPHYLRFATKLHASAKPEENCHQVIIPLNINDIISIYLYSRAHFYGILWGNDKVTH